MQMGLSSNQAHIHHHGQTQTLTPSQPIYLRKHATLHQHAWVGLQLKPKSTAKHEHAQARYQHKTPSRPKAPLSIWAAPSGEASTSSDVEEREGVAALRAAPRRRSCCREEVSDCRCVTMCS